MDLIVTTVVAGLSSSVFQVMLYTQAENLEIKEPDKYLVSFVLYLGTLWLAMLVKGVWAVADFSILSI